MSPARDALDRTLLALADPTRRRVVELLLGGERRAGELAEALEMSPPALSRHLKHLRAEGLVEPDGDASDARIRVYRLRREPFDALVAWIGEVEAFWAGQLDAFKTHAEQVHREGRRRR